MTDCMCAGCGGDRLNHSQDVGCLRIKHAADLDKQARDILGEDYSARAYEYHGDRRVVAESHALGAIRIALTTAPEGFNLQRVADLEAEVAQLRGDSAPIDAGRSSATVDRWALVETENGPVMETHPDGQYVLHEDYAAQRPVPDGWSFERMADGSIVVTADGYGRCHVRHDDDDSVAAALLHLLVSDMGVAKEVGGG